MNAMHLASKKETTTNQNNIQYACGFKKNLIIMKKKSDWKLEMLPW